MTYPVGPLVLGDIADFWIILLQRHHLLDISIVYAGF